MKHTYYIRQSALFRWYRNRAYGFDKYFIGKNVLEVGPNKGVLFEKYYPVSRKYTLLEPNRHFERDYLKLQRRHGNLHYEINGFESYAGDGPFDTIVMMAVIAHIRMDPERLYEKIESLLVPGGWLIIETNNTKRNLGLLALCNERMKRLEAKTSYNGIMKRLRIDYREVFVYERG
jgi:2-polyprenyl-3-methyl-5-hydroxy-6-metoxy-1,4-benzoquinol methylase